MGCVRFSLAGDTGKVWGEPGRDLAGSGPRPIPQILCLTCLHSLVHVPSEATFLPGGGSRGFVARIGSQRLRLAQVRL